MEGLKAILKKEILYVTTALLTPVCIMAWLVLGGSVYFSALLIFSGLLLGYAFAKKEISSSTVLGIMLASALLFPAFKIVEGLPSVRPEEAYVFIIAPVIVQRAVKKATAVDLALLLMALSIAISTFYGHFFLSSHLIPRDFLELVEIFKYWLLFRLALEVHPNEKVLQRLLACLVCSGLAVVTFSLFQFYNLLDVNSYLTPLYASPWHLKGVTSRVVGTESNPNTFGLMSSVLISVVLAWLIFGAHDSCEKIKYAVSEVSFLTALFMTQSRTAFVTLVVSTAFLLSVYLFQFRARDAIRGIIVLAITLVLVSGMAYSLAPSSFPNRMQRILTPSQDPAMQNRFGDWARTIKWIRASPILGWGPGKQYLPRIVDNEYLFILSRYGVVGLIIYLTMYVTLFLSGQKLAKSSVKTIQALARGWQATVLIFMISGLTMDVMHHLQSSSLFWLLAGFSLTPLESYWPI